MPKIIVQLDLFGWAEKREKKRAQKRAEKKRYKKAHPDKVREQKRRRYAAHAEHIKEKNLEWCRAHPDSQKRRNKRYRAAHPGYDKEYQKEWRKAHPDKAREWSRKWSKAHPEKRREYARKWRKAHYVAKEKPIRHVDPEKIKERSRERNRKWLAEHRDLDHQKRRNRRARIKEADGKFTTQEWNDLRNDYGHRCAYCNRPMDRLTADHIIPLTRGGTNGIENIVPACHSCNSSKNAKPLLVWMYRRVSA